MVITLKYIGRFWWNHVPHIHLFINWLIVVLNWLADPTYMIRAIPSNASDNVYCTLLAHSAIHGGMAGYTGFTVGPVNGRHAYIPFYVSKINQFQIPIHHKTLVTFHQWFLCIFCIVGCNRNTKPGSNYRQDVGKTSVIHKPAKLSNTPGSNKEHGMFELLHWWITIQEELNLTDNLMNLVTIIGCVCKLSLNLSIVFPYLQQLN